MTAKPDRVTLGRHVEQLVEVRRGPWPGGWGPGEKLSAQGSSGHGGQDLVLVLTVPVPCSSEVCVQAL